LLETGIGTQPPAASPKSIEPPLPRLVRIGVAAKALSCSVVTVRRLVKKRVLRHHRRNGRLLFEPRDLRLFLEAQVVEPEEVITIDLEADEVVIIDPETVSTNGDI